MFGFLFIEIMLHIDSVKGVIDHFPFNLDHAALGWLSTAPTGWCLLVAVVDGRLDAWLFGKDRSGLEWIFSV